MNLAHLLQRAGRSAAESPALAQGAEVIASYGELARCVSIIAGQLRARHGLEAGDRVALALSNRPEGIELLFACWQAGLAAVPMNAKLHASEFAYMLENSGARLCFVSPDLAPTIATAASSMARGGTVVELGSADHKRLSQGDPIEVAEVQADDLAWLFYTSGTTGRPKGAMITHRNLFAMALSYFIDVDHIGPADSIIHAAPLSHGSGLYVVPHVAASARHVVPESGGFEPDEVLALLPAHPGSSLFMAPTMVKRLTDHPGEGDTTNLKTIIYGGGPMYVEHLKRAMARFGQVFVQIYGQGESPMTITSLTRAQHGATEHPDYEARLASVGRAQSVVEVRIADGEDRALPPGELGEVLARGDSVIPGYWRNPEGTAETLRGGWLHTGDLGVMDESGFLTLKDRSKDVIISGGANIYPREIEEVLLRHEAVSECAVIGRPDPDWGETVFAFVVPRPGASLDAEALDGLCLEQIARFKRPKAYRFLEALPKNNYGKVLKTALREMTEEA